VFIVKTLKKSNNDRLIRKGFPEQSLIRFFYLIRLAIRVILKSLAFRFGRLKKEDLWHEVGSILHQDLGGLKGPLLKLGQMMAYLFEEMPQPIQLELRKLLIDSPACDSKIIRTQIENHLGKKIEDVFAKFDELPLATGSVGQIHKAELHTGETVVVKVALPGIEKIIQSDMSLLRLIVPLLELTLGVANMNEIFSELKELMIAETNFLNEMENNLAFQKICANDPDILVPRIFPEFCSAKLLVMEFVEGKTFYQFLSSSTQAQKNRASEIIWEFSARSANRFLLFNGDPHPGNYIFLDDGRIGFVDFGFCKRWDSNFHALWKRQTRAGMANDLEEFSDISRQMGIASKNGQFNYSELMLAYQKYSYAVWSNEGEFQFNRTSVKQQLIGLISAHTKIKGVSFPRDLLVMTRLFWGLQTIMALLNARFDVRRLTIPYLEQDSFEPFQVSLTKKIQTQIQKLFLGSLPKENRIFSIRENVKIPKFAMDPRFEVVVCKNRKEYETAFQLLHDSYVGQGLMNPVPEGIRCSLHSFLPETTTILAKFNGMIVGTLSLNLDSSFGLPSDSEFKNEIDLLRFAENSRIIEVTGFAVDKDFRNQGNAVSLLLMKFLYFYCRDWLRGSHLVCAVRKKVEDFYTALFQFERHGPVVHYRAVNSVEGVFLSMNISEDHENLFRTTFANCNNSEFSDFIMNPDCRMKFPDRLENVLVNFTLTPEVLEYFLLKRTRLLKKYSSEDIHTLVSIHQQIQSDHTSFTNILERLVASERSPRQYRAPVHIFSRISTEDSDILTGAIKDMNSRGAFVHIVAWKGLSPGQRVQLRFEFLNKKWSLKGQVRWISTPGASRLGTGIGLSWDGAVAAFDLSVQSKENYFKTKAS
jgi:predicted unusual protein kinase regulating ubiquinone biosynthesis (AarF/ABC1/UbiB family)